MKKHLSLLMLLAALIVPWASKAQDCTQNVPFTEDFESYAGVAYNATSGRILPTCWTGFTTVANYTPCVVSGTGSYVYTHGGKSMAMTGGTATTYGMNKYVLLPPMSVSLNQLQLSFWMCTEQSSATYGTLHVGYVTSDDTTTFVSIASYPSSSATVHSGNGQQAAGVGLDVEINLSNVPATATRLAFKWEHSNSSYHTCCIDDVVVDYIPTCPRVDSVSVAPGSNEAVFSWSEMGSASAWDITVYDATGVVASDIVYSIPATITGLTSNTNYSATIRSVCGISDTSLPRSISFKTLCDAVESDSLPWTYGVEDASGTGASATFNPCMQKLTNYSTAYPYPSSTNKHSGNYAFYFYSTSAYYSLITLPMMEEDIENLYLTFWAYKTSANYGHVYVGVMSNPGDITTFDTIATMQVNALSTWEFFEVSLAGYTGNGGMLALLSPSLSAASYVYIDDITVSYPPSCPTPGSVTSSNATANSIDLTWVSSADEYIVEYGPAGFTQGTGISEVASSNSITITGLTMGTTYGVYITAICGDDTSNAAYGTFTTGCGYITSDDLPYSEDFEAYGTGSSYPINGCWHKGTNSSTAYPYPYSTAAVNGSRGLYMYGYYPSSSTSIFTYSWAALPKIDDDLDVSTLMINLKVKRGSTASNYYTTLLYVGIADSLVGFTSASAIESAVTWIDTLNYFSAAASSVHDAEISFDGYTGEGKYVVIYAPVPPLVGSSTYAYNYAYVDDIVLRVLPTCFWPAEVALDSVTAESAVISWTPDPRTTEPSGWNIEYGLHGFTLGEGETETATDTIVELTNLLPNTAYDVYVSADCGGDESDPTMFTFRTACVALDSLPYTQDFEQETTNTSTTAWAVPCWGHLNNATTNFGYPYLSSSSTYNHTSGGTKGLYWYGSTTATTYGDYYCLVLPAVDADLYPINTLQVKFWAKSSSTSYNVQFQVGVMTDPNDINSFQLIENVVVGGNTTWTEYTVALGTYEGEGQYIAIKGVRPSSTWYAYMDDITIETMPPCPAITGIEATTTVGSALLNWEWQAGYEAPDNYVVTYDSVGGTNPTTVNATTNSIVLTGLAAATGYKAYVQADCGSDGMGRMDSITFTTGQLGCIYDPNSLIDVTVGNGTTTNSYIPSYSLYNYGYTQQFFTASEIGGSGNIMSITLTPSAISQQRTYEIYMGQSSDSSAASFVTPQNLVCVYNGGHIQLTAGQPVTFNLTTPYPYSDTANLVVIFRDMTGSYVSGNSWLGHTAWTNASRYVYQDASAYSVPPTGGTASTFRNNITFFGGVCIGNATCADPSVIITEMDSADVTIAWAPGYDETSWDISHRIVGDTTWITDASAVSTTSYTFSGLTPATEYEFRVSFLCSDGIEYAGTVNAMTPCAPMPLPYTQNFDHLTTGTATSNLTVVPNCWEFELTGSSTYQGASYYPGVYYHATYPNSGNYCYRLYGEGYHLLPEMSAPLDSLMLSFYDYTTSASYALSVGVMEDGMFIPIQSVSLTPNEHNYVEVTFSSYHGNSRTIALRNYYTSSGTYYSYHYIDDLRVEYIPECERPIEIEVTALGSDWATVAWDSIDDSYEVYYSTTPVNPDTVTGATILSTVTNNITLTGLTQNTEYFVYVRTICGATTHSEWSNEFAFHTACAEQPLPYTENFESYGTGSANPISPCWVKGTNNTTAYPYPYSTNAVNGVRSLYFYAYHPSSATATAYYSYAALPMFQDSTNRLMLSFNVRRYGTVSNLYTTRLVIGVMTNPNDISTFFPMDTLDLHDAAGSSIHGYEYCFNNYTGTGRYLAIYDEVPPLYGTGTSSYSYAYVDDILVDTIPTCMRPQNVHVTGITQNSATVHWSAGENASSFEIEYGPAGYVQGMGTTMTTFADSVTLSGLNPSTTYDVYVRAICSATDQSQWSFAQSFATVCGPTALPMVFDPDNYSTGTSSPLPNCWTRTNNATGTTNYYPYIYGSSANAHTGTNTLYYYFSTSSGYANDELMAFPEIDIYNFPMNSVEVSFWAKASTTGKHFLVGVMSDPTNVNSFVTVDTIALTTTSTEYTVEFSNYNGAGAYVALRGVMEGTSSYYIYVDDIYIGVMSHCPRAYDLTAYNGTATGATLEWTDTIGSTQWAIEYGVLGTTTTATVTANSNPYTITGLTANTVYYYRVAPICSDGVQADWSHDSYIFSTSQVPATVPYTYNFEDGTEWNNWQTLSNNTVKWSRGNVVGNPGYSMYLSTDNGVTRSWDMTSVTNSAVYRDFDFGATPVSYELSFDALVGGSTDGNYDGITIMVVDPAIVPEASSTGLTSPWGHIGTVDVRMDTVWAGESVYLDGMQGVKRLVFFHFNQATATTHPYINSPDAIDNIAIGLQPCARPYDLAANNITDHTANLSWAGPATDMYLVAHRVYGASATTNVFDTVMGTSLMLSGLNADEEYIFWVTHICSLTATDTLASDWSNGFRFTTECAIHQLPFLETFDSVTPAAYNAAGELPDCWRAFSNGTNAVYMPHVVGSGSYYYYVTGNALTMTSGSETYGNTKIVALPPFNAPVSACGIRFHYRHENASNGTLEIGYVTSADLEATFHPLVALPGTTTMTQIDSTLLSGAPANATRIALRWIYTTSFYSVGIDNIEVWANELCPAPTATVSNIEAQAATVTVTGSGIAYELEYGTDNANLGNTMTSTTGVFNLTGLQPETQYFYAVRQQCDSTLFSSWYTGSFTTDELGCLPPTNFAALNTDYTAATLGWTVGNEETAWEVHVFNLTFDTVLPASTTSITVNGLDNNTAFSAAVRALCGVDNDVQGPWSDTITFTTDSCYAVTNIQTNVTATTAVISWTGTSASYRLAYMEPPFNMVDATQVTVTTNSYTITGLYAETQYVFVIVNNCAEGVNTATGVQTFTTLASGVEPTYYSITVVSNNPEWGTVTGGGNYQENATVTLTATANEGYHFEQWNDGVTNATRTITVTGDATYTAFFAEDGTVTTYYTVTVTSNNDAWGTVSGGGQYAEGSTATITATPASGYRFVEWNDGNTQNPRSFTVTADVAYVATFEATEGIGDVMLGTVSLYPNPASTSVTLGLDGFEGEVSVDIVDMNGRVITQTITQSSTHTITFDVNDMPQGAYFVRVVSGTRTAVSKLIVK